MELVSVSKTVTGIVLSLPLIVIFIILIIYLIIGLRPRKYNLPSFETIGYLYNKDKFKDKIEYFELLGNKYLEADSRLTKITFDKREYLNKSMILFLSMILLMLVLRIIS